MCLVHLPTLYRHKLSAQSVSCVFMGYSVSHKGYICYDPSSRKFHTSRNVVFFEDQYYYSTYVKSPPELSILPCFDDSPPLPTRFKPGIVYTRRLPTLPICENASSPTPDPSPSILPTPVLDPLPSPRRSTRQSCPPTRYGFHAALSSISIPTCFSQAVKQECWRKAMDEEIQAIDENFTWRLLIARPLLNPLAVNGFILLSCDLMGL